MKIKNINHNQKIIQKKEQIRDYIVYFLQIIKDKIFGRKFFFKFKLITLTILFGVFTNFIFINFIEQAPIQLRKIENACGKIPENYIKPEISNNPNYVFRSDSNYQNRVLWDETSNIVIVNSFIECEHYFTGGWNYFSKEYYSENEEISCLQLDKLKDQNLTSGFVYFKNISLKEFFVDKNSLCMGSIQNLSVDGNINYFEVQYSRTAYIFITQLIPILFLINFFKISWFRFALMLTFYQIFSQLLFNYYIGLNMFNSVSIFSSLALLIIKLKDKNEITI